MKNRDILILLLLLISCDGIFIPDPIDPRLPMYTETGNNAAGAIINDQIWKGVVEKSLFFVSGAPQVNLYDEGDSLVIQFSGIRNNQAEIIKFHIEGIQINALLNLTTLDNTKIILNGIDNFGAIENLNTLCNSSGGIGQLYLRRITVTEENSIIISGTFGFTINGSSCGNIDVSYGRFDYVVR